MRQSPRRILLLVLVIAILALPGLAAAQDPIYVQTFRNEFVNWATPHVDEFAFPSFWNDRGPVRADIYGCLSNAQFLPYWRDGLVPIS